MFRLTYCITIFIICLCVSLINGHCTGVLCRKFMNIAGIVGKDFEDAFSDLRTKGEVVAGDVEEFGSRSFSVPKKEGEIIGRDVSDFVNQSFSAVKKEGEVIDNDIADFATRNFSTVKKEGEVFIQDVNDFFRRNSEGCHCIDYNCGCCAHLEEPEIELNSTICVNASYLAKDYGISLTVTVNQYTIFNETVSVRNPPPICLGIPYVKEWAEVCVRLHDIDATKSHLHACVRVEARMKRFVIAKYEFGCFDIGPHLNEEDIEDQYPAVIMV